MHNRLEDNQKILKLLEQLIYLVPDQRFGQILSNYVIPQDMFDIFFPEGDEFIKYMEENIQDLNQRLNGR